MNGSDPIATPPAHPPRPTSGPPLFRSLLPITAHRAARDVLAGLSLAAMNIPQALGYTKIAGMPVITGLYTLLLPVIAFAALGSSRYLWWWRPTPPPRRSSPAH
ncbi:MAG: SulP family inorganic anion transporter [Candidatus Binatia bacterium]